MIAIDLYGNKIERSVFAIDYQDKDEYFLQVCNRILKFRDEIKAKDEQILGVGFAMQGLVSPDRQTVVYGRILACTGLSITAFTKYLPYPCSFIHDADSAAISELWISPELHDAFYLSLSKHLGASIITKRELLDGKHGHSSVIEHIQMEQEGKMCYCGKRGCMETLCSIDALLTEGEDLETFFEKLEDKDTDIENRWRQYLQHLAKAINLSRPYL